MPVPADPPVAVAPAAFRSWALDVADTAQDHETRLAAKEPTLNAAGVVAKFTGTPDGTKFLRDDGTLATPAGGGGSSPELLHVQGTKTAGTDGGSFTADTWVTRELNTTRTNGITGASVASNTVTLPAGTYDALWDAVAVQVGTHRTRLRDTTSGATIGWGSTHYSDPTTSATASRGSARFTLASTTNVQLQHYSDLGKATIGLGYGAGIAAAGEVEVYVDLQIRKV